MPDLWLILVLALLVPGLLFLIVVVVYIAFVGRPRKLNATTVTSTPQMVCLQCGQTLLPHEHRCPKCGTEREGVVTRENEAEIRPD